MFQVIQQEALVMLLMDKGIWEYSPKWSFWRWWGWL